MRRALSIVHRWLGLFSASFLFVAGLTGAIIAWDHELDAWLNPALFRAAGAPAIGAEQTLALAEQLEREDARVRLRYMPLSVEAGQAFQAMVAARTDPATGNAFALGFDQLALDPTSGKVQGRRLWGEPSLARENLLPFLYRLHYTLHVPSAWGVELGVLIMGVVAIVWTLDCFIALAIAFPSRKAWLKSFMFRLRSGRAKLTFDLHRSGGVWVWPLLLTLAVTAVSLNLREQVMRPLVSLFSPVSPRPFAGRELRAASDPSEPAIGRHAAVTLLEAEAARRGIQEPAGALFYAHEFALYGVGFFAAGHDHGDGGLGNPWLYLDARDGHVLGAEVPGKGSAGDLFMQAQFPLHSGRLFGVVGRTLVSLLGLAVATLSVTGVLLWARRQRARSKKTLRLRAHALATSHDTSGI